MTDDGLRDMKTDFGDREVIDQIHNRYGNLLKNEVLMGEPIDVKEVNTAMRKYDHGQASDKTVVESGVKAVFDPEKTALESLQNGGTIRQNLKSIARTHFTVPLREIDLMVSEEAYTVWLLPELDESLF